MSRVWIGVCAVLMLATQALAQEAARTDGWVVLPIDEYRALRARAFATPPDPAAPPVDAALTRVDYELRANGDSVTGQARLTIDVLKQGWASVQVPPGLLVRDARLDGRPTALVDDPREPRERGAPPRVLLSKTGRSTLSLDVVVPMTASAGTESMTLPPSGSALAAVTLAIPRTGVALTVAGGFVAEQTETANETRWVVYGNPGRPLTFAWKHRTEDVRASLPLRTRARITELVALGEDTSQVTCGVQLEVTQGQARDAVISLPAGLIVNQVSGPAVADWNVDRGALALTFLEPVATSTSILISGEVRAPRAGAIGVPILRVPAAERESGGVAVDVVGPGDLARGEARGLEPADPSDLGDVVKGHESPSMTAFRFSPLAGGAARSLTVNVTRYTAKAVLVANIEEARYDALVAEEGKLLVRARYAVRNNQRSFLAVALPPDSFLWSAALGGRPIRPGVGSSGSLLLPLQKGRSNEEAPAFVVELLYLQRGAAWTDKADARIALPAVDVPVSRTGVKIFYSPRYEIDVKPGAFRAAVDPGPYSALLRGAMIANSPAPPAAPAPPGEVGSRDAEMKVLIDRVMNEAGRTREGVVPLSIDFPAIGPSTFVEAELTAEAQVPAIDIQYHRTGGR